MSSQTRSVEMKTSTLNPLNSAAVAAPPSEGNAAAANSSLSPDIEIGNTCRHVHSIPMQTPQTLRHLENRAVTVAFLEQFTTRFITPAIKRQATKKALVTLQKQISPLRDRIKQEGKTIKLELDLASVLHDMEMRKSFDYVTSRDIRRLIIWEQDPKTGNDRHLDPDLQRLVENPVYTGVGKDERTNQPFVGAANYFVSYNWDSAWDGLMAALSEHSKQHTINEVAPYYWVDIFSIMQHADYRCPIKAPRCRACKLNNEDHPDWSKIQLSKDSVGRSDSGFPRVLKHSNNTLVYMDPWERPRPPRRIWCNFEMYMTLQFEANLRVLLDRSQEYDFQQHLSKNFQQIVKIIANIDIENVNATDPRDIVKIRGAITRHMGDEEFNLKVRTFMNEWIIAATKKYIQRTSVNRQPYDEDFFRADGFDKNYYYALALRCGSSKPSARKKADGWIRCFVQCFHSPCDRTYDPCVEAAEYEKKSNIGSDLVATVACTLFSLLITYILLLYVVLQNSALDAMLLFKNESGAVYNCGLPKCRGREEAWKGSGGDDLTWIIFESLPLGIALLVCLALYYSLHSFFLHHLRTSSQMKISKTGNCCGGRLWLCKTGNRRAASNVILFGLFTICAFLTRTTIGYVGVFFVVYSITFLIWIVNHTCENEIQDTFSKHGSLRWKYGCFLSKQGNTSEAIDTLLESVDYFRLAYSNDMPESFLPYPALITLYGQTSQNEKAVGLVEEFNDIFAKQTNCLWTCTHRCNSQSNTVIQSWWRLRVKISMAIGDDQSKILEYAERYVRTGSSDSSIFDRSEYLHEYSSNVVFHEAITNKTDEGVKTGESKRAAWSCTKCTFLNHDLSLECEMCGAPTVVQQHTLRQVTTKEKERLSTVKFELAMNQKRSLMYDRLSFCCVMFGGLVLLFNSITLFFCDPIAGLLGHSQFAQDNSAICGTFVDPPLCEHDCLDVIGCSSMDLFYDAVPNATATTRSDIGHHSLKYFSTSDFSKIRKYSQPCGHYQVIPDLICSARKTYVQITRGNRTLPEIQLKTAFAWAERVRIILQNGQYSSDQAVNDLFALPLNGVHIRFLWYFKYNGWILHRYPPCTTFTTDFPPDGTEAVSEATSACPSIENWKNYIQNERDVDYVSYVLQDGTKLQPPTAIPNRKKDQCAVADVVSTHSKECKLCLMLAGCPFYNQLACGQYKKEANLTCNGRPVWRQIKTTTLQQQELQKKFPQADAPIGLWLYYAGGMDGWSVGINACSDNWVMSAKLYQNESWTKNKPLGIGGMPQDPWCPSDLPEGTFFTDERTVARTPYNKGVLWSSKYVLTGIKISVLRGSNACSNSSSMFCGRQWEANSPKCSRAQSCTCANVSSVNHTGIVAKQINPGPYNKCDWIDPSNPDKFGKVCYVSRNSCPDGTMSNSIPLWEYSQVACLPNPPTSYRECYTDNYCAQENTASAMYSCNPRQQCTQCPQKFVMKGCDGANGGNDHETGLLMEGFCGVYEAQNVSCFGRAMYRHANRKWWMWYLAGDYARWVVGYRPCHAQWNMYHPDSLFGGMTCPTDILPRGSNWTCPADPSAEYLKGGADNKEYSPCKVEGYYNNGVAAYNYGLGIREWSWWRPVSNNDDDIIREIPMKDIELEVLH